MARSKLKHVGVDVSAKELHVAIEGQVQIKTFANTAEGHKKLLSAITKKGAQARVVVEATSTYHLDLCLALDGHKRCEVMVANPRATNHYHQARGIRAKTDKVDARTLLAFAMYMPFEPWTRPERHLLELRATARYVAQLVKQQTRLKNQLAAATSYEAAPDWLAAELAEQLEALQARVERARERTVTFAKQHADVWAHVVTLTTIPGIGEDTAVRLVAELLFLDPEMTAKQVTAWAGLDPRPQESGTSRRGRRPISKRGNRRVRGLLYMPALTAARCNGPLKAFYERVEASSGQKKVATTAVMRRLLVIAWAMYRSGTRWDATMATPRPQEAAA